jgi:hypothetical protein
MSQGLKVLSNDLRPGLEYRIVYTGQNYPVGYDILRYKNHVRLGYPHAETAHQFLDKNNRRYYVPTSDSNGPLNVDSVWSFTQVYEGPMASGYGPNSGGRRTRRRRASRKTRSNRRRQRKN